MALEHYAEAWTSRGDGCYRYVDRPSTPGQPMRCPHPAVWTGEQSSRPETDTPQLGMFYVGLDEIYAMPKVTQKLVDVGSFDVMAWLQTKVGEAFGTKEGWIAQSDLHGLDPSEQIED